MTRPIQQHLLQLQLSLDACQVDAPRTTRACKTAEIKHYEQQQQQQQQQQQRGLVAQTVRMLDLR